MKKNYVTPEMDRLVFSSEDICVASGNEGKRSIDWDDMFDGDHSTKELEF